MKKNHIRQSTSVQKRPATKPLQPGVTHVQVPMDFFDCPYYSMTRKLLLLIGQWPFQDRSARLKKQIFVCCIAVSTTCVQIAKVVTSHFSPNVTTEIVTAQIAAAICAIKYSTFSIQTKKIKQLLESIESDWNYLENDYDRITAEECAEEGRKYIFRMMFFHYLCAFVLVITFILQPVLDVVAPKNETRVKVFLFPGEYFIDDQKYYCPITLHMSVCILTAVTVIVATDTMLVAYIYHACGIFKVISYRLEHAFDNYKPHEASIDDMNNEVRRRIASAVKYHETATQFVEVLVSVFNIPLFLASLLVFSNISITLYWAAMSLGTLNDVLLALLFGTIQLIHTFILTYACQKVINDSSTINFKAYCGLWYMAPYKLQTLILPILQRGTKPTTITVVKMLVISLEFFGKAIQLSLSYFMVLLSVM